MIKKTYHNLIIFKENISLLYKIVVLPLALWGVIGLYIGVKGLFTNFDEYWQYLEFQQTMNTLFMCIFFCAWMFILYARKASRLRGEYGHVTHEPIKDGFVIHDDNSVEYAADKVLNELKEKKGKEGYMFWKKQNDIFAKGEFRRDPAYKEVRFLILDQMRKTKGQALKVGNTVKW